MGESEEIDCELIRIIVRHRGCGGTIPKERLIPGSALDNDQFDDAETRLTELCQSRTFIEQEPGGIKVCRDEAMRAVEYVQKNCDTNTVETLKNNISL